MTRWRILISSAGAWAVSAASLWGATVVVTPSDMDGWHITSSGTAGAQFESGPAVPPAGTGSIGLDVGAAGASGVSVRNTLYAGKLLADLEELSYWEYTDVPGSGGQSVYIILHVDHDNDGGAVTPDDLLFFEPEYQSGYTTDVPDQGDNPVGTWNEWDARAGGWWSLSGFAGLGPGADVDTLDTYFAAFPNATIRNTAGGSGGVRLVAGFGAGAWDNFEGNADLFHIKFEGEEETDYDFELDSVVAAPEPATLFLLGSGIAGLIGYSRRRKS